MVVKAAVSSAAQKAADAARRAREAAAAEAAKQRLLAQAQKKQTPAPVKDRFEPSRPEAIRGAAGAALTDVTVPKLDGSSKDSFQAAPEKRFDLGSMTRSALTLSPDQPTTRQTQSDEIKETQLTTEINNEAAPKLTAAKATFDEANEKVQANKAKLADELRRIGPGLTAEQKKQYIEAFNEAHAEDNEKLSAAATQLAQTLQETKGQLSGPTSAKLAMDSAKALASTPEGAETAVAFVKEVATHPDEALYQGLVAADGAEQANATLQKTLGTALPNMMAEALKECDGDPALAAEKLKKGLEGLETAKGVLGNMEAFDKGVEALSRGDFKALEHLEGGNPISDGLKALGVVIGIAKVANGTAEPQDVLGAGKDAAELTAMAMESLAKTLPEGAAAVSEAGSKWLEKLAPGLGLVAGAFSMSSDFKSLCKDPNAGDALKLIGDSMSTVGSALALTGVGEVVGGPLQVVGGIITATGSVVKELEESSERTAEMKELLTDLGVEGTYQDQLLNMNPAVMHELEADAQMTPEQVQALITEHPDIVRSPGFQRRFIDAAKACGVKGEKVLDFARALEKDSPGYPLANVPYNEPPAVIRNGVLVNSPSTRPLVQPS